MAVPAILNFGQFSICDLNDIEGRVIPFFRVFLGQEVHFWGDFLKMGSKSRSNQTSKVKFDNKSEKSPNICRSLSSRGK